MNPYDPVILCTLRRKGTAMMLGKFTPHPALSPQRGEGSRISHPFINDLAAGILKRNENGKPELAVSEDEVANHDSELIACEIECIRNNKPVVFVDLKIEGID